MGRQKEKYRRKGNYNPLLAGMCELGKTPGAYRRAIRAIRFCCQPIFRSNATIVRPTEYLIGNGANVRIHLSIWSRRGRRRVNVATVRAGPVGDGGTFGRRELMPCFKRQHSYAALLVRGLAQQAWSVIQLSQTGSWHTGHRTACS